MQKPEHVAACDASASVHLCRTAAFPGRDKPVAIPSVDLLTIDDGTARLQISMPLAKGRWFRGRYVNAQCSVRSGSNGKPQDVRITSITVNGRPVGEEVLEWRYGRLPSFRSYVADWITQSNLKTLEISDGKVILESKGTNEDPFASESPSSSASLTPAPTTTSTPTP